MNTVEPIRDINIINDIADYLKVRSFRNFVLFMFGIYSGLRVSDILNLRVRDVKNKDHIYIRERKTNKEKRFVIHEDLQEILKEYIKDKADYEYLFKSRKGLNKPITREHAYAILKDAANAFGIENLGTHSMRKTFGYFIYQETKDAVALQEIFNHDHISTTLRYIGVNQDHKDNVVKRLKFKIRFNKKRQ